MKFKSVASGYTEWIKIKFYCSSWIIKMLMTNVNDKRL